MRMMREFLSVACMVTMLACSANTDGTAKKTGEAGKSETNPVASTKSATPETVGKEAGLLSWEPESPVELKLWHTYRDKEREALGLAVKAFNESSKNIKLISNYTPYDGFENKLRITITKGEKGPDLFIDAHDKLGSYVTNDMVAPLNTLIEDAALSGFDEFVGRAGMRRAGVLGVPRALFPRAIGCFKA